MSTLEGIPSQRLKPFNSRLLLTAARMILFFSKKKERRPLLFGGHDILLYGIALQAVGRSAMEGPNCWNNQLGKMNGCYILLTVCVCT